MKPKTVRKSKPKPNLFIVGSMKCGTTILYDFLCEHSKISGARGKEVHYFSLFEKNGPDWYLDHFEYKLGSKYYLDASPTYFDLAIDHEIPLKIKKFSPKAKIIIMIREPIERAVSHFLHMQSVDKLMCLEGISISDFLTGNWPPNADVMALNGLLDRVKEFSFYSKKIERFTKTFGKRNVFVICNRDLRGQGKMVMRSLFSFLDLPFQDQKDYSRQRYVRKHDLKKKDDALLYKMRRKYGKDYWEASTSDLALRPTSDDPEIRLNAPVGACIDDVSIGQDGFLFLTGGRNSPVDMFFSHEDQDRDVIPAWVELSKERKGKLGTLGITYLQCMIPEKLSILGDALKWELDLRKSYGQRLYASLPDNLKGNYIHLFDYFRNSPVRDKLYFKTDSHWSYLGAFSCYQMICATLKISPNIDFMNRPSVTGKIVLDLGGKLPEPVSEEVTFFTFRQDAELLDENELVTIKKTDQRENDIGLHVGSSIYFRNLNAPDPRKLMLFGDSFSETRDHLLTGLMAETFKEVIFVWSTSLDYALIEKHQPDIVLCASTERFMAQVPNDDFDLSAYVEGKICEINKNGRSRGG